MKRLALITAALLLAAIPGLAEKVTVGAGGEEVAVRVLESGDQRVVLEFDVGAFERTPVDIAGEAWNLIGLPGEANLQEAGLPDLPIVCRSVIIPDDAKMDVRVVSSSYVDFQGVPVAPSKGVIDRTVDPATVPYVFDGAYQADEWYPRTLAWAREPYILRDFRGLCVVAQPFQYNPATQTLRVFTRMVVEVVASGPGETNVLAASHRDRMNREFHQIYQDHFLNFSSTRYTPVEEVGEMLIITYDAFHADMVPLVEWKNQMGVKTTLVDIGTIGNTSAAITSYIQNFYNTHDLAFVLLVGDLAQIASPSYAGGESDPSYSLVAGSDNYPDIFVGRFSATTSAHVQTQVERTITYERDPNPAGAWYHMGTGIASNQGPGDDGEYDYVHMNNIRTDLLGFTYTLVDQIYDPTATAAQVATALNQGRSIIDYCGHGSTTAWSSSGFSVTNVNALVNNNMLPFIFSVACVNGDFSYSVCFAEAWLRATNGSTPTGAIGMYASSINQSWNSPMCGQDEMVDLLVAEARRTYAALCFNGSCQMMDEYGSDGVNMFRTWNVFGDPSVRVRTDTPTDITVVHGDNIEAGAATFDVSVPGVAGALCALSYNGGYLGSAFTDAGGSASIPVEGTLPENEDITVTVTAFNAIPSVTAAHVGPSLYPTCDVSPSDFALSMGTGETHAENLAIANNGDVGSVLAYSIEIVDEVPVLRSISGSTFLSNLSAYDPNTTFDIVFSITGQSTDSEWIKFATVDFPSGVTVNSSTNFAVIGSTTRWLDTDGATGDGAMISWAADGLWGEIYPGETAQSTVNVTATAGFGGDLVLAWTLTGDNYGSDPHTLSGTITLTATGPSVEVQAPNGGEVWGIDESHPILWASSGDITNVDIDYSTDGGSNWTPIVSGTPNDGMFDWTVAGPKSDDCRVRIRSTDGLYQDVSDAAFTIYQPITWMTADPVQGTVGDGAEDLVALQFDTDGLADGDYLATIIVHNNAGPDQYVPVVLTVSSVQCDPNLSSVTVNDALLLAPDGNGDSTMTIVVTVRDSYGNPMPGVPAGMVHVTATGVSSIGQNMFFCASGGDVATFSSTSATDPNGETTILVDHVGGCGMVGLSCTVGSVALTTGASATVHSPDFNGDGQVNFFDTFQYVPMLYAGTGDCGNLNNSADGVVNFFDTAKYLPFLAGNAQCP